MFSTLIGDILFYDSEIYSESDKSIHRIRLLNFLQDMQYGISKEKKEKKEKEEEEKMLQNDSNEFNETKPASLCFITLRSSLLYINIQY